MRRLVVDVLTWAAALAQGISERLSGLAWRLLRGGRYGEGEGKGEGPGGTGR